MSPAANPSRSQLSVQIDADVHEATKAAAYWGRRPKAAIVEDALRAYLDTLPPEMTAPLPGGAALSTGNRRQDHTPAGEPVGENR
jgi:hypothetical protein